MMIVFDGIPAPRWATACELPSSCEKCWTEQNPMQTRQFMNADFHRSGHKADCSRNAALDDPESLSVTQGRVVRHQYQSNNQYI